MVQSAAHQTLDLWILVRFRVPQPFLKELDGCVEKVINLQQLSFLLGEVENQYEAFLF